MAELTKALMDEVILAAFSAPARPTVMLISSENKATFEIIWRADEERWNWRRTKRELRKGSRSTYHKRVLH